MEQTQDLKMKGINVVDEHQPEKMDVTSIVNDNQHEKMDVNDDNQPENVAEIVRDEEDLPDAKSCSDDDTIDDDDEIGYELLNQMDELPSHLKGSYKIVHMNDIRQYQIEDINIVRNTVPISRAEATILLLRYNWNVQAATEAWIADANGTRKELGLSESFPARLSSRARKDVVNTPCGKCSGIAAEYPCYEAFCNHKFCNICWQDLIKESLTDHCLIVRCPVEDCNAVMNPDLVRVLALQGDQTLYSFHYARSYLLDSIKGKWCPTMGCNHAVLVESGKTISNFTCQCLLSYCYKCLQESHEPVSCAVADCWNGENTRQKQNWEIVYLRNCPICEGSLQINGQYKHMECPSCNYHFCNTCLCSWLQNGHWAADYFTHICTEVKLIEVAELLENRAIASKELNRYRNTLEHWEDIDKDQHQTLWKLHTMQEAELKPLAEKLGLQLSDTSFVSDVWQQIAKCKRIFKWASVYEYYILAYKDKNRTLFDELLRKAAYVMEHLCIVASELRKFIATNNAPAAEFEDLRERLCFKSSVAKNFFENMAIAIQRGYPDMKALRMMLCSREWVEKRPAVEDVGTSSSASGSAGVRSTGICEHCSFSNDSTATFCVMCYH